MTLINLFMTQSKRKNNVMFDIILEQIFKFKEYEKLKIPVQDHRMEYPLIYWLYRVSLLSIPSSAIVERDNKISNTFSQQGCYNPVKVHVSIKIK